MRNLHSHLHLGSTASIGHKSALLRVLLVGIALLAAALSVNMAMAAAPTPASHQEGPSPANGAGTGSPHDNCLSWNIVSSPNLSGEDNTLYGVDAVPQGNAWAVGMHYNDGTGTTSGLFERWDGNSWTIVQPQAPVTGTLRSVSALDAGHAWAVGYTSEDNTSRSVIAQWDGAHWFSVPSPHFGTGGNLLYSVHALAQDNVWAVGNFNDPMPRALLLYWNGSQWNQASSPDPEGSPPAYLYGLSASSATDMWAVGAWDAGAEDYRSYVLHWTNGQWTRVAAPTPPGSSGELFSVAALGPSDVWAVGRYVRQADAHPFVMHWDGTSWSIYYVSVPWSAFDVSLNGVTAVSPTEVYAVGSWYGPSTPRTFTLRWDGTSWARVDSPNGPSVSNRLNAVRALGPGDVLAVGNYGQGMPVEPHQTLVERYTLGTCITPTPTRTATSTATPPCGPGWNPVANPSAGATDNSVYGLAAVSPTDIWAVGSSAGRTMTMHWDGTQWSLVPSPSPGTFFNILHAVTAISHDDVWAVGSYSSDGIDRTLIEHWDGALQQWSVVPSPGTGPGPYVLLGVSAFSPTDIWAVGQGGTMGLTLAMHWDGNQWSIESTPNVGTYQNTLNSVVALSGTAEAWAVGRGQGSLLIEHWTAAGGWSIAPAPAIGVGLYGVTAVSASNIWAVGGPAGNPVLLHYDGNSWAQVSSPDVYGGYLYGISAAADDDIWAVGTDSSNAVALHYDGNAWTQVPVQPVGFSQDTLYAVAALQNDAWAVGNVGENRSSLGDSNLVMRYSNPCGANTPTVTPTSSASTATPTATQTPTLVVTQTPVVTGTATATTTTTATATSTAASTATGSATPATTATVTVAVTVTATASPCVVSFSDVQPSDYFYQAVQYLACHGAISGYSDGTFRPYNNTTRGQLSKIVVLAEGWAIDTQGGPHFSDVPEGSTFYPYIETAYNRGVISGYSDGTFRWGNNVTRGQLAKIIVLAQNWAVTPPSQPTFQDVPVTHPFYGYVETAYAHGVISGYSCGTGCLEFRPGNNATRGQISKIVYNAVTQP